MATFATLFSGGELAGVGIRNAGLVHKWGLELDDDIAGVARLNGFNILTANILDIDPETMEPVDALHASPPCTRASNANQSAELNDDGTKEAPLDIALGEKVAEFIDVLQPRIVTIENVYAYRNFKALGVITAALDRGGYFWDYDNINSADFGVPQTRRRLFLRAVRGALLPPLPAPEPWGGWLEAIADLIPTLPDSKFAKWQEARLPAELTGSLFVANQIGTDGAEGRRTVLNHRQQEEPSPSVVANERSANNYRAFILSNAKTEYGDGIRDGQEPAGTVTGESNGRVRAWLIGDQTNSSGNGVQILDDAQPALTVRAMNKGGTSPRAYLVSSVDSTARNGDEPATTVVGVGDGHSVAPRAWLSQGRVVKLTPRALARFQSVPDSYILPDKAALACKVIGNGVACLMIEKIYRQLTAGG